MIQKRAFFAFSTYGRPFKDGQARKRPKEFLLNPDSPPKTGESSALFENLITNKVSPGTIRVCTYYMKTSMRLNNKMKIGNFSLSFLNEIGIGKLEKMKFGLSCK